MNANATKTAQAVKPCTCSTVVILADNGDEITTNCKATTKRTFAPGHNARLKGFLIRAGVEGNLVTFEGSGMNITAQAMAESFGFGYMVAAGIALGAKRAFAKMIQDTKKSAKKSHQTPKKVSAKVGRWTYEGVISDDPMHGPKFTYTNAKGVQTTTTKFTKI